jgi:outer membrane receptor protein involved in Fe transport
MRITPPFTAFALVLIGISPSLTAQDEEAVFELSPFLVQTESQRGYLSTNSVTATGFNIENYKVPLNISVVTEGFLEDLAITDLADATEYMAGVQRGSEGREGASYFIRGFQTAWLNRNGIRRYNYSGTDNVKQMEVLKGPNAVFYGRTAPGGIVNYVTKRPEFNSEYVATTRIGENDEWSVSLEAQGPLWEDKVAYRVMGTTQEGGYWQPMSERERTFLYGGVRVRPINGLDIYLEYEQIDDFTNHGGWLPMGNYQYMEEYENPPQALQDYILSVDRRATPENILDRMKLRWLDIGTWQADHFQVYGERPPRNVDFMPEATPYGDEWNTWGPNGYVDADIETITAEALYQAFDWLSFRAVSLWDERYQPTLSSFRYHVRGDGSIQVRPNPDWGLFNDSRQIKLETIVRVDFVGFHTFVGGYGQYDDSYRPLTYRFKPISQIPWYENWHPFEDPIYDLQEALETSEVITLSGEENVTKSYYLNVTSEFFDGRVHTLLGIRHETYQRNFVDPEGNFLSSPPEYKETTPMMGATWEFKEGFTLFASYSQSARPGPGGLVTGPGATEAERSSGGPPGIGEGMDLGIKASWRDNLVSGTFSLFEVSSTDEKTVLDRDATDLDPRNNDDDPNNNVTISRRAGESRSRGIELEGVYTPSEQFQMTFQYTWLAEAEIVDDPTQPQLNGLRLGNAPEHSFGFWNRYTFTEGRFEGFTIGGGGRYTDRYNAQGPTSPNQYDLPAYWAFDALFRYGFKWKEADVSFTLNIKNVFDKRYYEGPPSRLGDPRTFRFTAQIVF